MLNEIMAQKYGQRFHHKIVCFKLLEALDMIQKNKSKDLKLITLLMG